MKMPTSIGSRKCSLNVFHFGTLGSVLGALMLLSASETALGQTNIPKYSVFEVKLRAAGNYTNPYLQMPGDNTTPGFVVGTITGPNNERITIDGFWDGGNTWKIRVAPTAVGIWSYTTSSSDRGLNGKRGSFNCVPSNSKGFVRIDPNHPHHFIWDDGTPFYWAPVSTLIAHFDERDALGGNRRVDNGTFQGLADRRSAQGFSMTHWGYYGFNKPQFKNRSQRNEGGVPFINDDPNFLNPAYHQFGDQRVKSVLDRNIIPQFTLGWPDQGILRSIGHTRLKRYWRYLIARYAAYNLTWNLFGEANEFGDNWLAIVDDYGSLTRKWDPYGHLITTHVSRGPNSSLVSRSWYDYIMLQFPTAQTSNYLHFRKPVINAEYGAYENFQVTGEQLRRSVWDVRMRGGYFVYESWGNDLQSTGANYASLANRFFRDHTRFWLLEFRPDLFAGRPGLANRDQEYITYLVSGGAATVDLTAVSGSLAVQWYNPRTGAYIPQTAITVRGGKKAFFAAPDANDWVLHLRR